MSGGEPLPRPLRLALLAGALGALGLLWSFDPLPIVDLPQHVAQVALLFQLGDPAAPFAGQYELNLFTPYLLAYLLAAGFALVLPLGLAFKAALSLIALFWMWALLRFQRRVGADPWWALAALPLFFGLSFFWGFFNYLLAVPLALLLIEAAYAQVLAPSRGGGLRLALLGIVTFFAHGMACAFGLAIAAALLVALAPGWRAALTAGLPLLAPAMVMAGYSLLGDGEVGGRAYWIAFFDRISLHRRLLGEWRDPVAVTAATALLLLAAAGMAGGRATLAGLPARQRWARRLPLLLTLAYLVAMPEFLAPMVKAGSRFLVFVPLFAGWWLGPRLAAAPRRLLAVLALGWLAVLAPRFAAESRRLAELRPLLEELPPRARLLVVRLAHRSSRFDVPLPDHQATWYAVDKGGLVDPSFADFRTELVRYRPGRQPSMPDGMSQQAWLQGEPPLAGAFYDYWLVYWPAPPEARLEVPARCAARQLRLMRRQGEWWLFANDGASP